MRVVYSNDDPPESMFLLPRFIYADMVADKVELQMVYSELAEERTSKESLIKDNSKLTVLKEELETDVVDLTEKLEAEEEENIKLEERNKLFLIGGAGLAVVSFIGGLLVGGS